MGKLTDTKLRAWVRAGKAIPGVSDGNGLTFRITEFGTAVWTLRYKFEGRARSMRLGQYPALSLAQARDLAMERLVDLAKGVDPLAKRQAAAEVKRSRRTFDDLLNSYMAREAVNLSPATRDELSRFMTKDVLPKWGGKPLEEISRRDVVDLVGGIQARSYSVAKRTFEILSVVFKHGIARGMLEASPMFGLEPRAVLGKAPTRRVRVALTDQELRAVLAHLPRLGVPNALAVRILLATACRKMELLKARIEHVDLDAGVWKIPDENSKSGRGIRVPLAPTVAGWFRTLIELARLLNSPWVLPGIRPRDHLSESTLNEALKRLGAEVRKFNVHDLRSTARSGLGRLGVDVLICERCLNHSLGGLVAVYDTHDYFDQRRAALELWAQHLAALERPATVLALPRAA